MNKALERYFTLETAIKKGVEPGKMPHSEESWGPFAVLNCPTCYAEEGWVDKLGVILQQHSIDLKRFSEERFERFKRDFFVVEDGRLKLKDDRQCVTMEAILRVAARQIE